MRCEFFMKLYLTQAGCVSCLERSRRDFLCFQELVGNEFKLDLTVDLNSCSKWALLQKVPS